MIFLCALCFLFEIHHCTQRSRPLYSVWPLPVVAPPSQWSRRWLIGADASTVLLREEDRTPSLQGESLTLHCVCLSSHLFNVWLRSCRKTRVMCMSFGMNRRFVGVLSSYWVSTPLLQRLPLARRPRSLFGELDVRKTHDLTHPPF